MTPPKRLTKRIIGKTFAHISKDTSFFSKITGFDKDEIEHIIIEFDKDSFCISNDKVCKHTFFKFYEPHNQKDFSKILNSIIKKIKNEFKK